MTFRHDLADHPPTPAPCPTDDPSRVTPAIPRRQADPATIHDPADPSDEPAMTRTRQLDKPGLCSPSQAAPTAVGFADFALIVAILAAAVLAVVFTY